MNKINCSKCDKKLDIVLNSYGVIDIMKSESVFSNDRCLKCFSEDFDSMSDEEKIPKFDSNLLTK